MAQLDQTATRVKGPPLTENAAELREYIKYLANIVAMLGKNLDYIINGNLDANNIRANSITANKLNVDELSAISANLGHITAGLIEAVQIFGSYIATSTGYPRVELSSSGNLFGAFASPTSFVTVTPAAYGSPSLRFEDGVTTSTIRSFSAVDFYFLIQSDNDIVIQSTDDIDLTADLVFVPDWSRFVNKTASQSLQTVINNLQSSINSKQNAFSGYDGSVTVVTSVDFTGETTTESTLNFSNGVLTSVT